MTVAPSGQIFVADGDNDRINIFNADGTSNSTFGTSGSLISTVGSSTIYVYYPSGIAMAESTTSGTTVTQYFYVGDQGNYRVQKLSYNYDKITNNITAPVYVAQVGTGTRNDAFGSFITISDLTYDVNLNKLFVVDSLTNVVQYNGTAGSNPTDSGAMNAALNYSGAAVQGHLNTPTGAAFDFANRVIYIADNQGSDIASFTALSGCPPTLTISNPATAVTAVASPYAINYSAGSTCNSAMLYLFYTPNTTWSGGSTSIAPNSGAGEGLIGSVAIAEGAPAPGMFNWLVDSAKSRHLPCQGSYR